MKFVLSLLFVAIALTAVPLVFTNAAVLLGSAFQLTSTFAVAR